MPGILANKDPTTTLSNTFSPVTGEKRQLYYTKWGDTINILWGDVP